MKLRFASPGHLIDINRVPGLDTIEEGDGRLRIGALVRHNELASSDVVGARYPTIAAAAPQIAVPSSATSARSADPWLTPIRRATSAR